jgi:hypothetical protein
MYIKEKKLKKLVKDEAKLRKYVEKKVLGNYFDFTEDFYTLAQKNNWVWFMQDITPDSVYNKLVDRIIEILTHDYDCTSSGRILITKHVEDNEIKIN